MQIGKHTRLVHRRLLMVWFQLLCCRQNQFASSFSYYVSNVVRNHAIKNRSLMFETEIFLKRRPLSPFSNKINLVGWRYITNLKNSEINNVHDYAYNPILMDLNENQIKAVTQPLSSISRVVAGPGSGKTRVLTSRIAYLLQEDRRNMILAVTFTRKAAGEMQERLKKLLIAANKSTENIEYDDVFIEDDGNEMPNIAGLERVALGTFHSICAKVLRWNGDFLSSLPSVIADMSKSHNQIVLDSTFNIIDQAEQLQLLKKCFTELEINTNDMKPTEILNAISRIKVELVKGENPFVTDSKSPIPPLQKIALQTYYPYREKLLSSNCIDFDDLIYFAREMLLVHVSIRERLQNRWKHILVDEFQDTSQSQLDLIKLLTSKSLFVVGDADQSIYSWRGAHVSSMSDFEREFQTFHHDGVSTVYLMENYRSTSSIVKAAQKVISTSQKGSDNQKLRQSMIPMRDKGTPPRVVSCLDGKAEAEFIVKEIKTKMDSDNASSKSCALIYRTNAQSRALEEACVRHKLPYVIFGGATGFYKRQEVKDCVCYLRWLYNGRDRNAMLRAMTTPKRGIGDVVVREFDQYCAIVDNLWEEKLPGVSKPNPLEVLLHLAGDDSWCTWNDAEFPPTSVALSARSVKSLVLFGKQMHNFFEQGRTLTVEKLLSLIISEMELMTHFDKISKSKPEFEDRKENVFELRQASERYSTEGACMPSQQIKSDENEYTQTPLGNFLDDITLVTETVKDTEESIENRFVVNLMTIHASKGMEFDTVYFVGLEDGTLPTNQALMSGEGSVVLEEEKRLCYVAMTRAKSELIMTWRHEVPIFTATGIKTVSKNRSRFLDALMGPADTKKSVNNLKFPSKSYTTREAVNTQSRFKSQSNPSPTNLMNQKSSWRPLPSSKAKNEAAAKSNSSSEIDLSRLYSSMRTAEYKSTVNERANKQRSDPNIFSSQRARVVKSDRTNEILINQQAKQDTTPKPRREFSQERKPTEKADSSWFFPVGSNVLHKKFGKGVVLAPKSNSDKDEMFVHIQFFNGDKREVPLHGTELSQLF